MRRGESIVGFGQGDGSSDRSRREAMARRSQGDCLELEMSIGGLILLETDTRRKKASEALYPKDRSSLISIGHISISNIFLQSYHHYNSRSSRTLKDLGESDLHLSLYYS